MSDLKRTGANIRKRRNALGLCLEGLAKRSNVLAYIIELAEHGDVELAPGELIGLANAFGVPTRELMR